MQSRGQGRSLPVARHVDVERTCLVMRFQRLIMLAADLSPPCEVVLGTDGVHLALEAHDFTAQPDLLLHVLRRGPEWEAAPDLP